MLKYYCVIAAFTLFGCSSSKLNNYDQELIDISYIQANLQVLSSDEFEGREATTRGEKLAALYISTELKKYGVKPFFEDSSYLQPVNLIVSKIDTTSTLIFSTAAGDIKLEYGKDFTFRGKIEKSNEANAEFIFAGFGISAPEYFYDNYSGLDVKNKYVLILDGEPISDDSLFFEGTKNSQYSLNEYKISTAKEKGALGCLIVADDNTEKYWSFIKHYSPRPKFSLPDSEIPRNQRPFYFLLNQEALSKLSQSNETDYLNILDKLSSNADCSTFGLSGDLQITTNQTEDLRTAYNVVGIIPGNDPALGKEYVAIGAHYDHEGIVNGVIFNGADDNASGTAAVLEIARALSKEKNNRRSVLILFHAAEEKGLLGSKYFTENLDIIGDIVAKVNLDMIGREHVDSLYSVGSDRLSSELKNIVEDVNRETADLALNYKFDDPNDPERIYYRSDHYNFARYGIPIVFFTDGMEEDYHKPTDDFDKIDVKKIQKVSKLVYGVVERLANLEHRLVIDKSN